LQIAAALVSDTEATIDAILLCKSKNLRGNFYINRFIEVTGCEFKEEEGIVAETLG